MSDRKFNSKKFAKLDSPERKKMLPVSEILSALDGISLPLNIADIGCGTGYLTIPLAEQIGKESTVYAIDVSSEMLAVLEEKINLSTDDLSNIRLIHSEENKTAVSEGLIDISFLITVLHELDDPDKFIQEIKRISNKENHRVVIVDWTAKERERGPSLEKAISKERAIQIFEKNGYKLTKEFMGGKNFYGLVLRNQA